MKVSLVGFFRWMIKGGALIACFILLAGCDTVDSEGTPEETVTERAAARLNALFTGDFETALAYTSPGYRQTSSVNQYRLKYAGVGNWTGVNVESVTCDAERCAVRALVSYRLPRPAITNTRPIDEVWIPVDGQWYIYEG